MLLLAGVGVWTGLRQSVHATVDRELRTRLETVRTYLAHRPPGARSREGWIREIGEDSMVAPGNGLVQISDAAGHWVYRSPEAASWSDPPPFAAVRTATGTMTMAVVNRRRFRILTASVEDDIVQIGMPLHAYDELTERFFGTALIASPLLLGLAAIAGYWLSRRALRPVDAITATARSISSPTLASRLPVPASDDELRRLSLTLNAMLDRLEAENLKTRQFTADASHELRTPVAVIRATADVTSSRPRSPEEHQQAWKVVQEQALRVSRMIDDLLRLARADASGGRRVDAPMDLADTVREACAEMQVMAARAGLSLIPALPASRPFRGDPEAIHRLVAALLDNAIKYTPSGGRVQVTMDDADDPDSVVIRVADTGIGLAAEDLAHVFDRFYRVSKDRSRETGGAGLGLAIVQAIARQHGGDASIAGAPGAGCVVSVTLPLCPDAAIRPASAG
jgi:heavy metal sensor kinase